MARGKEVCDETRPKKHIKSKNPINQWWFHPPSTTKKGALGAKGREVDKKDRTRPSKLPFNVICTTVTVGLYGLRHMHASWLSLSLSPCLAASFPFGLSRWPPSFFSQLYPPSAMYDQDENESTKRSQTTPLAEWCPRGSNSGSFAGSFQLGRSLFSHAKLLVRGGQYRVS